MAPHLVCVGSTVKRDMCAGFVRVVLGARLLQETLITGNWSTQMKPQAEGLGDIKSEIRSMRSEASSGRTEMLTAISSSEGRLSQELQRGNKEILRQVC